MFSLSGPTIGETVNEVIEVYLARPGEHPSAGLSRSELVPRIPIPTLNLREGLRELLSTAEP
jgi:hypothetical protein